MEDILGTIKKLDGKLDDKKFVATVNANKRIAIKIFKGPNLREVAKDLEDDRFEHWDPDIGKEIVTFQVEYTDSTAENGFLLANIMFFISLMNDPSQKDSPRYYEIMTSGDWKDEFGDTHELIVNKQFTADEYRKAVKYAIGLIDDYDNKYLPEQCKKQLIQVMEDTSV